MDFNAHESAESGDYQQRLCALITRACYQVLISIMATQHC